MSTDVVQQPSTLWVPERKGSYGPVITPWARSIGIQIDATQERDIDCLASYGRYGRWLAIETLIVEGRQNGKTKSVMLPIALADFFLNPAGAVPTGDEPDRIIWTSHRMRTSLDTFERIKTLIKNNSTLSSRVAEIRESKTEQGIELWDGTTFDFFARANGSGRGLGARRLVFDEAMFLRATDIGSFMPTLSARDVSQINYGSSAEGTAGDYLRSLRARGRRANDPSLVVIDYKAPGGWDEPGCALHECTHLYGVQGCVFDREDYWAMANHAIGQGRIRLEFVRSERRALGMTPEGVIEFGRERLGWGELGGDALDPERIPRALWDDCEDRTSVPVGPVCFAVDMGRDAAFCSITVAGRNAAGKIHFGVIAYEQGSSWVPGRLAELLEKHETMCPPIWQPSAPVGALAEPLRLAGIEMRAVTDAEVARACGALKEHVKNRTVAHTGGAVLNRAFDSAERWITSQGAWVWGRKKSGTDISPVCGITESVYGVDVYGDTEPSVYTF